MHVFNYRITTDYDLNLKWYDPRLIFRNLKPDETFNDLGKVIMLLELVFDHEARPRGH